MLLKSLMEDKQLDFYQPLLSVRRYSSTAPTKREEKRKTDHSLPKIPPIPSYKSELKSGPIRDAGTVPFIWEKSPGRPKDEGRSRNHFVERTPIAPKLPPGRIWKSREEDCDNNAGHPVVRKNNEEVPYKPRSVSASNDNSTNQDSSKDDTVEVESSDSEEGDEVYLDALDMLSRSESLFLNCSVSGISGLDGSDVNTYGNFSPDPQTRDFMMSRFLPAAKAMTSETPEYVPRKQHVTHEQPRQMMKVRTEDRQSPLRYGHNVIPHYAQEKGEEESDDDFDEHEQFQSKACGLLPRFCLKGSFGLLNPVPGMSVRTRVPMSPSIRTHVSSLSSGSSTENGNEHIKDTVHAQSSVNETPAIELHKDISALNNQSDELSCPFNPQKLEGSTLYRRFQGSGRPPHHNDQSNISEQKGFHGNTGEAKEFEVTGSNTYKPSSNTLKDLLADPSSKREEGSVNPVAEKSLYVDIVHTVESPSTNPYTSYTKELPNLRGNTLNSLEKSKPMEEAPSLDSSFKDKENVHIEDTEADIKTTGHRNVDFSFPSLDDDKSYQASTMKMWKGFVQHDQIFEDFTNSVKSEVPKMQQSPKPEELEKSNVSHFPVPPPLPKSPSDSWLGRTLPSMSSRTLSLQPHFGSRTHMANQTLKTNNVDPKWGTFVKTTNRQRRYDALTTIPEN